MTVEYTSEVATAGRFGSNFGRLLLRWKGSIYKAILPDLIVYLFMYLSLSVVYRFYIIGHPSTQIFFERLVKYCGEYAGVIPVSFVLGFYVSQIVTRWWNLFMTIPWPDTIALCVATSVRGPGDRGRLMRRTLLRYVNLSFVMTMTMLSPQARARFPSHDHLVEAGFMMPHEQTIFLHLDQKTDQPKYWVPIIWAATIAARARKEGLISDDVALMNIIENLTNFRTKCGDLLGYDWVCIPIVYTQVVTLAVYVYFFAALIGKQFIQDEHEYDLYIPIFVFLEFFFYMGWLKVAETMVNPFGEDDDDFEVNWLIDRHFTVSYMIVDDMHEEYPEMLRDQYWDDIIPDDLAYTPSGTARYKTDNPQKGSAAVAESRSNAALGERENKRNQAGASRSASIFSGVTRHRMTSQDKMHGRDYRQLKPDTQHVNVLADPISNLVGTKAERSHDNKYIGMFFLTRILIEFQ